MVFSDEIEKRLDTEAVMAIVYGAHFILVELISSIGLVFRNQRTQSKYSAIQYVKLLMRGDSDRMLCWSPTIL